MQTVVLKRKQIDGSTLQVSFVPEKGMNLVSLKKDQIELIEQSTTPLFEERCAGLGALIGPHFHHMKEQYIPKPCPENLFPHIPKIIAKGGKDYFSHGIARYVPWKYQVEEYKIFGKLSSVDLYENHPLAELEGLNFYMTYEAELLEDRLRIRISSNSDLFSVVGLHYYFSLPSNGEINAQIHPYYYSAGEKKELPKKWLGKNGNLHLLIDDELDYGFIPKLQQGTGKVIYTNSSYRLELRITPEEDSEVSFQVYHPLDAHFVCIEPISATNPRGDLPKGGALIIDFMINCLKNQND